MERGTSVEGHWATCGSRWWGVVMGLEKRGQNPGMDRIWTESRIQNPVLEVYLTDGSNETVEEKREQRMILSNQMDGEHIA